MIDALASLSWREPLWLWLALYPWLWWGWRLAMESRLGRHYAEPGLLPWARATGRVEPRRLWRPAMLVAAWVLFAMAMAGPRLAETHHGQERGADTELMVVLDVSRSMTARDVEPGRLERAKLELHDLVDRADRLGIGLVVYAARPHLMNPPTLDKRVLRHNLQLVRHGLLPTEGSNLRDALEFAAGRFTTRASARALLLVTDGELAASGADAEADLEAAAVRLAQRGIVLYVLGVGTPEGAALMDRQGGWLRHEGEAVVSRLHGERLRKLALLGHGRYETVADTDAEWRSLHDQGIRRLASRGGGDDDRRVVWRELYGWCLAPALLFLLLAQVAPHRVPPAITPLLVAVLLVRGVLDPGVAQAGQPRQQEAFRAFAGEDYPQARRAYAHVPGYAGRMGEGASAYRLGEYRDAAQRFTQAVLDADTDAERADALFNLANSQYKLADYDTAVRLYREVLRYDPKREAVEPNLELALAMRERTREGDQQAGTARPGQGPRAARLAEGSEIARGSVSLDEGQADSPPAAPAMTGGRPLSESELIDLGIHHSRSVVQHGEEFTDSGWGYAPTTVERILLQAESLRVDESILWQRLFETEEGFPAPVETPRALPDVPPW